MNIFMIFKDDLVLIFNGFSDFSKLLAVDFMVLFLVLFLIIHGSFYSSLVSILFSPFTIF